MKKVDGKFFKELTESGTYFGFVLRIFCGVSFSKVLYVKYFL